MVQQSTFIKCFIFHLYFKDLIEIKPNSKSVTLVELYYLSYGLSPFDHKLISKITFKQENECKKERKEPIVHV